MCNWENWFQRFRHRLQIASIACVPTFQKWRDQRGLTLLEMTLVLTLLAIVVAAVGQWTIPFLKQDERVRNEWLLQSESLLFYHDLARELRAARSLEIRNRMLYASIPEVVDSETWLVETVSYQYYLDTEGRFIRRVWRKGQYEGYTIMLQHIQTLHMAVQEDGRLRLTGTTARGGAVHSFDWIIMPRVGGMDHGISARGTGQRPDGDTGLFYARLSDGGGMVEQLARP